MRITDSMRYDALSASEDRAAQQLSVATQVASSGLKVAVPSDDPVAYAAITEQDASIAQITARQAAATQGVSDLSLADDTLASATTLLTSAQQIALSMANGDQTAATRAQAAQQIDGLSSDLVGLANTQGSRGYLFAGTATSAPPFTASGAFVGNDGAVGIEVADGTTVTANASGANAFTAAGGVDVFQVLQALSTALNANSTTGVQATLSDLDQAQTQIIAARSEAGIASSRLSSAASVSSTLLVQLDAARAGNAEADPVTAYSQLAQAQAAYQANIQVTGQILSVLSGTRS